ncbi:MAG TPA: glutaredoxin 3 [Thioalkalivibrio sp.]|jgi:glutaredoxin 3|nr:glutaredoxin 3 [Thioalkalivibrio sp.]
MSRVRLYRIETCPFCDRAEALLKRRGVAEQLDIIHIDDSRKGFAEMARLTGQRTVPQIFVGDHHVGGFDDLVELDMDGELDALLEPVRNP